jgi:hypothetical protein
MDEVSRFGVACIYPLNAAHLEGADLSGAQLEGARLYAAHLEGANLSGAHLEGADLGAAHLEGAILRAAHLEGAILRAAHLEGAALIEAFLDPATVLRGTTLSNSEHGSITVADTRWGGVNLATVAGALTLPLGDEQKARRWQAQPLRVNPGEPRPTQAKRREHHVQQRAEQLGHYQDAVRANRQLATALRDQGLNEDADRFGYRARFLQRQVLRLQRHWLRYLGALFLDLISGHGYRPLRSIITYVLVILTFAGVYLALAPSAQLDLTPAGALFTSMISFHGRGFFPGTPSVNGPFMGFVAAEALCGLLLEITFIATFTNRFFAR